MAGELQSIKDPPPAVVLHVTAALSYLLAPRGSDLEKVDITWFGAQKMLSDVDKLLEALKNFDAYDIPAENKAKVMKYTGVTSSGLTEPNNPEFNYDFVRGESIAAAILCNWIVRVCIYNDLYLLARANPDILMARTMASEFLGIRLGLKDPTGPAKPLLLANAKGDERGSAVPWSGDALIKACSDSHQVFALLLPRLDPCKTTQSEVVAHRLNGAKVCETYARLKSLSGYNFPLSLLDSTGLNTAAKSVDAAGPTPEDVQEDKRRVQLAEKERLQRLRAKKLAEADRLETETIQHADDKEVVPVGDAKGDSNESE
eukprot:536268-Prymnesium_polylepis.2